MKNLEQLKEEGLNAIRESQTLAALQQHRVLYLGKKRTDSRGYEVNEGFKC